MITDHARTMNSAEIRRRFLQFFAEHGHTIVASSPLVPANDPTLLFTNSGMVQFKDVFLGRESRPYVRATSSQRSVRAGGKHNDLENVGYTARHHTFFEMLGNFSFGDYFKREAIQYAWALLTEVYGLPAERLWVTVYAEDQEAYDIWVNEVGVPAERCIRIGDNKGARYASDNFWQMADTGPCGPCSEIFYDHGPEVWGGPPGSPEADGDRYIEVWNLVFMQYSRDESGTLTPLPRPCVDTGMGLERLAAILQGVHSNYEIDLFRRLVAAAARATGTSETDTPSLRVIADHIRACAFLIVDGVIPGNEGRGYVLRRIIRRALRHGHKLGQTQAFFHTLVADLDHEMGEAYPELSRERERVAQVLRQEELRFGETLEHGMKVLDGAISDLSARGDTTLPGQIAFMLYDTYGFPLDLTADVCRERGLAVDQAGFDVAMARQRDQARAAGRFHTEATLAYTGGHTEFRGYDTLTDSGRITALYRDGIAVPALQAGEAGVVVLDVTPFYAESGGQVGDRGRLTRGADIRFLVQDTRKIQADVYGHHGVVESGSLALGDMVVAEVDGEARHRIMRNHSATHLMHAALRQVLGSHVQQKGSLVDADKTRFDFSHPAPLTDTELREVALLVNRQVLANTASCARQMDYREALAAGAMALFGEKYADSVRVLDIGFSRELCGGTHVARTGDIGLFKIVAESGVASGVRRIEAITGEAALMKAFEQESLLAGIAAQLRASPDEAPARVEQLLEQLRTRDKELMQMKSRLAANQGEALVRQAIEVAGVRVLATVLDGADVRLLRESADQFRQRIKPCVVVVGSHADGKVNLVAAVSPELAGRIHAGELAGFVAAQVGGKGGGRADMAQAGGSQPDKLGAALASVQVWLADKLGTAQKG
ncbi:MAG: Alanine--tRNA ligase [Rhodocyclaceae bacterium]|nr:Alanine--tRNA ligase [Rhodocyclaceae bacterium]